VTEIGGELTLAREILLTAQAASLGSNFDGVFEIGHVEASG